VITTVGLLLAFTGFVALFASDPFGSLISQVVAAYPELDAGTAYALGSGMEMSAVSNITGLVFVLGHLVGTVILGIALFRAHAVPSWIAIALAVSQPIHLLSVMTGNRPLDLVGWGATALRAHDHYGASVTGLTAPVRSSPCLRWNASTAAWVRRSSPSFCSIVET